MKMDTIKKLCCPFDRSDLQLTILSKDLEDHVLEGILHCAACRRVYPIVSAIPIMNPDEYREFAIEQTLLKGWLAEKMSTDFRLLSNAADSTIKPTT